MIKVTDLSDFEVLTLTIYGEARGEPIEGQVAVGCVLRNRLSDSKDKGYKEICLEPKQFSCWNVDDPNYPLLIELAEKLLTDMNINDINDIVLDQCQWVANGILTNMIIDNTHRARNYVTTLLLQRKPPAWLREMKVSAVVGNQTFFIRV